MRIECTTLLLLRHRLTHHAKAAMNPPAALPSPSPVPTPPSPALPCTPLSSDNDLTLLNDFVTAANLSLVFDFDGLQRDRSGRWDPSNAKKLLDFASRKRFSFGFELGNGLPKLALQTCMHAGLLPEPNSWKHKYLPKGVRPETLAADYNRLDKLRKRYPFYANATPFIGPSGFFLINSILGTTYEETVFVNRVDQARKSSAQVFLGTFLRSGGARVVTAASFHQYHRFAGFRNPNTQPFSATTSPVTLLMCPNFWTQTS